MFSNKNVGRGVLAVGGLSAVGVPIATALTAENMMEQKAKKDLKKANAQHFTPNSIF